MNSSSTRQPVGCLAGIAILAPRRYAIYDYQVKDKLVVAIVLRRAPDTRLLRGTCWCAETQGRSGTVPFFRGQRKWFQWYEIGTRA